MNEVIRTILVMSLSGSVLALFIFLTKPIMLHRLPKFVQYYMWIVVLVMFLIPISKIVVLPYSPANVRTTAVYSVVDNTILPIIEAPIMPINQGVEATVTYNIVNVYNPMQISPVSLSDRTRTALPYLYFGAVLSILLYGIISYFYFLRQLRKYSTTALSDEICMLEELSGRHNPSLYRSKFVETPMLTGIFKPSIILPDNEYTPEELRLILVHELSHLRQFDIHIKWLMLIACAVHWFNPIVWLLRRELDCMAELACDEKTIRNMDDTEKQSYGDVLINIASKSKPLSNVLSTRLCENNVILRQRLAAIMKNKSYKKIWRVAFIFILAATMGTACILGAGRAEPAPAYSVETADPTIVTNEWWRVRESKQYYVLVGYTSVMIQESSDLNFVPPAKVELSFAGTVDEIVEWKTALGRAVDTQFLLDGRREAIENLRHFNESGFFVLDLYDEAGNLTSSVLGHMPMYLGIPQSAFDPSIHQVSFVGTHLELWEKYGTQFRWKPRDLWPIITFTDSFGIGTQTIFHPPEWDMDAVEYVEFLTAGKFSELMDFWGYTEAEVDEILMNSACELRESYFHQAESFIDESIDYRIFAIFEFYDKDSHLIGRFLRMSFGDFVPEHHVFSDLRYFKSYDDFIDWKETQ